MHLPNVTDDQPEKQSKVDDFFHLTREDLTETIQFLIEHRELLRDEELSRLEEESTSLAARLKGPEPAQARRGAGVLQRRAGAAQAPGRE